MVMSNSADVRPSLVVSTADNPRALDLTLESVSLQTKLPVEVLIADDGSDERTSTIVGAWAARLPCRVRRTWRAQEDFVRSIVLNELVRTASGNYLIFVDGDCLLHRRFIVDHVRHAQAGAFVQGRRAGVRARYVRAISARRFQPLWLLMRGRIYGARRAVRRPWAHVRTHASCRLQRSNFAMWRDDFFRVNGYDEILDSPGHEDAELAARLSNAGLICKTVVGQAIVYHLDHRPVPRYDTGANERAVARTRREKRIRCERGVNRPAEH